MSGSATLTLTALAGVPNVTDGDNLVAIILSALEASALTLQTGDVVVLAQKIVSKSEGRTVDLATIEPSDRARELAAVSDKDPRVVELILRESTEVLRSRPGAIIVAHRLGFVCANAGIDQSNVGAGGDDRVLLLPKDPDASSAAIRRELKRRTGADVAVLVIDSIGRAWRNGTIGTAIGLSGLPGLLDLRTRPDLFGRPLQTSELGLADELASAASLIMGQAAEGRPIVLARGVPYDRREGTMRELIRPKEMDLFR
ncbi:MAG TPA: coenzyme F420-0:L-glutamate ligase [Alphaproteobacteria bacterium]|nr:coenzyme F420-0:L-glutamate ligase [Alphaproteobacteria bacterium]